MFLSYQQRRCGKLTRVPSAFGWTRQLRGIERGKPTHALYVYIVFKQHKQQGASQYLSTYMQHHTSSHSRCRVYIFPLIADGCMALLVHCVSALSALAFLSRLSCAMAETPLCETQIKRVRIIHTTQTSHVEKIRQ